MPFRHAVVREELPCGSTLSPAGDAGSGEVGLDGVFRGIEPGRRFARARRFVLCRARSSVEEGSEVDLGERRGFVSDQLQGSCSSARWRTGAQAV